MADTPDPLPDLLIATNKVGFIIAKSRQFDVKEDEVDPEEGSNPTDDGMRDVLQDDSEDSVELELRGFIDGLDIDEQIDLVALAWLGRGDGGLDEWAMLRAGARDALDQRVSAYLMGIPLLSDYLEEGLSLFGLGLDECCRYQ
jgi:hypothetical protein